MMKNFYQRRGLQLEEINRRAYRDPASFAEEENQRYIDEVNRLSRFLAVHLNKRRIVMLCGPTSSGKTTTALLLRDALREIGVDAHTVSIDDFYRGRELAPVLEDGSYDYESLEALDLRKLQGCMQDLVYAGRTQLPIFDFVTGRPAETTRELVMGSDSVVIFEGIHALNPIFEEHLSTDSLYKIFINTVTPIYDGSDKLLARRSLRLVRRMFRDERFRGSPVADTLKMWPQVVRGENLYMFPYVDTADIILDTTHAYEPCVLGPQLLPLLEQAGENCPDRETVEQLKTALRRFTPMDPELVPEDSMLREFLGGGRYS